MRSARIRRKSWLGWLDGLAALKLRLVVAHASIDHEWPERQQRSDEDHRGAPNGPSRDNHDAQQREGKNDEQNAMRPAEDLHRERLPGEILEWHGDTEQHEKRDRFNERDAAEKWDRVFHQKGINRDN